MDSSLDSRKNQVMPDRTPETGEAGANSPNLLEFDFNRRKFALA